MVFGNRCTATFNTVSTLCFHVFVKCEIYSTHLARSNEKKRNISTTKARSHTHTHEKNYWKELRTECGGRREENKKRWTWMKNDKDSLSSERQREIEREEKRKRGRQREREGSRVNLHTNEMIIRPIACACTRYTAERCEFCARLAR